MPNFFIIGAGKSGTTSLYHYLKQHPDVFMSAVKEPLFFAFAGQHVTWAGPGAEKLVSRAITSLEDYQALFHEGFGRTALGEASSAYLYYPAAAERLRRLVPDAKLMSSCAAPPIALIRTGCMRAGPEMSRFPILRGHWMRSPNASPRAGRTSFTTARRVGISASSVIG